MKNSLSVCIQIDEQSIYQFSNTINEESMIQCAQDIEQLLIQNGAKIDKIQNVIELFIETMQNMLNYAQNSVKRANNKKEVFCDFSLSYFTETNFYILESCNLINHTQQEIIEQRINAIKDLDEMALRKLIRKKSRSKVDNHEDGAGLGFIMMARRSSSPIEILFIPHDKDILKYKQKLTI